MPRCIDADALKDDISNYDLEEYSKYSLACFTSCVIDMIDDAPTVETEPLYWETWAGDLLKCPACKYEYTDAIECTNFCGNCGVPLKFKKIGFIAK